MLKLEDSNGVDFCGLAIGAPISELGPNLALEFDRNVGTHAAVNDS